MRKIIIRILSILIGILNGCSKTKIVAKTFYLDEAFSIVPVVTILEKESLFINENIQKELSEITNHLDNKFNVFKENSMISKVNNEAFLKDVLVDNEFLNVLKTAIRVSDETKINNVAMYDITIYSIWEEWNFKDNYYVHHNYCNPPSEEVIKQKLPLVDIKNILINDQYKSIYFTKEGTKIDLGSIVKGYAADLIYEKLIDMGFNNFLIDVGGNIVTSGNNIGTKRNWKVGITKPFSYNEEIGYVEVSNEKTSVVTSGIYERYILSINDEGKETMYHHILNPITGYPIENELISVSIFSKESIRGDAYSTAIFSMGLEKGMEFVNGNNEIDAIFITKNKEIYISEGIKGFIANEEIYKDNYKIIYNLL